MTLRTPVSVNKPESTVIDTVVIAADQTLTLLSMMAKRATNRRTLQGTCWKSDWDTGKHTGGFRGCSRKGMGSCKVIDVH